MIAHRHLDDAADIRSVWLLLSANKWLVLAVVVLFTLGSAAAGFLTKPVYRARVVLIPAESDNSRAGLGAMLGDIGGLAALAGIGLGGDDTTVEATATLRSQQFAREFIADKQLVQRFFYRKWDAKTQSWSVAAHEVPTEWDAWRHFDRKIRRVSEDRKTGLVTLEIDWIDRQEAADWANDLVARLNSTMRARAIAEADASIRHLEKELSSTDVVTLQQAIYRLIETHIKRRTMAMVRPEFAFRVVDPATASDEDGFIRPKRTFYLMAGPVAGLLIAVFAILGINCVRRELHSTSTSSSTG